MKKHFVAAAVALSALLAGGAQAATYNLDGSGGNLGSSSVFTAAGGPAMSATAGYGIVGLGVTSSLVQGSNGLGVTHVLDTNAGQVDGSPLGTSEYVTFNFGWAVKLLSFGLAGVDGNDNYDISINGGLFTNGLAAAMSNLVGVNYVTSFTVRASGTLFQDGFLGNDEFSIKSVNVAAVPVPAAGLLLLGALGGLAALRRRKAASV